ncbi:MAG: hypothetical protein DWI58_08540 [Chloroflexi bacterium]|nr:MAG: hypothetical protein DWI58_08540 [Chloroflexota bacterium]
MFTYKFAAIRWKISVALMLLSLVVLTGCSNKEDSALKKDVSDLKESVAKLQAAIAPTPVKLAVYKQYGFTLPLPDGLVPQTAGIGSASPSNDQGQLTSSVGGVSMVLIWTKQKMEPAEAVQGAFEVLKAAQPAVVFRPVNQGEIKVDGQAGQYGAFAALDKNEKVISTGAIGGWNCKNGANFTMIVSGAVQAAVEGSFQGFSNGFKCPA